LQAGIQGEVLAIELILKLDIHFLNLLSFESLAREFALTNGQKDEDAMIEITKGTDLEKYLTTKRRRRNIPSTTTLSSKKAVDLDACTHRRNNSIRKSELNENHSGEKSMSISKQATAFGSRSAVTITT